MLDIPTNSIFKSKIFIHLITFWLNNLFRHHKCPDASSKLQNKFKFSSKHFILSFTSTATVLSQISVSNAFYVSLVVSTSRQIEIEIENVLSVETNF